MNTFCVIVTTYQPGIKYIRKCLKSIENQSYKNYSLCIYDDGTEDNDNYKNLIKKFCVRNNWNYVFGKRNKGPLYARMKAIENLNPKDEDIIISIDGDDELNNRDVFSLLNSKYQDNTLLTFGNWIRIYNDTKKGNPRLYCKKYKLNDQIKNNSFRDNKWIFSHLKTFKYKLYKNIDKNDFKYNNQYITSSTDLALMYPMLEMSNGRFKCVQDILYNYNYSHPISNHNNKIHKLNQKKNADLVRSFKRYKALF